MDGKLEVVRHIGCKNLADIGARLRELADWVEANPEAVRTVLVVSAAHDRVIAVNGYGERCSAVEALGWLDLALHRVRGTDAPRTDLGPPAA
jgi:hypothetical protein